MVHFTFEFVELRTGWTDLNRPKEPESEKKSIKQTHKGYFVVVVSCLPTVNMIKWTNYSSVHIKY